MRFVFIDKILDLEPGRRIRTSKTLSAGEELFRDHFPGFPVVPGVLLTEMMAQAAGKCLDAERSHPGRAMLAQIRSASFRSWVRPDETLTILAEIVQNQPAFATAACMVEMKEKKVATAELFFAFAPHRLFAPGLRDDVLEAYWEANPSQRPENAP